MTCEKFEEEVTTLLKFFSIYCRDKHTNQISRSYSIEYKGKKLSLEASLCTHCHELFNYALARLLNCPKEPKPRCRKCPDNCYDKLQYVQMAKIMRYSGVKLGLSRAMSRTKKKP